MVLALVTAMPLGVNGQTFTVKGVTFKMIPVAGGMFMMGDNNYARPPHLVTLSNFSIGETEVTQELWQAVMGSNPSDFAPTQASCSYERFVADAKLLNAKKAGTVRIPTLVEWNVVMKNVPSKRPVENVS